MDKVCSGYISLQAEKSRIHVPVVSAANTDAEKSSSAVEIGFGGEPDMVSCVKRMASPHPSPQL